MYTKSSRNDSLFFKLFSKETKSAIVWSGKFGICNFAFFFLFFLRITKISSSILPCLSNLFSMCMKMCFLARRILDSGSLVLKWMYIGIYVFSKMSIIETLIRPVSLTMFLRQFWRCQWILFGRCYHLSISSMSRTEIHFDQVPMKFQSLHVIEMPMRIETLHLLGDQQLCLRPSRSFASRNW